MRDAMQLMETRSTEGRHKRKAYYMCFICFIFLTFFKHNSFLHIRYVNLLQTSKEREEFIYEIQNKF